MKYFEELKKSMEYIAKNKQTMFIGQAVEVPGTAMSNTLKDSSVPTRPNTNKTCFKFGKVIYQNSLKKFVPSIFDAS